MWASPARSRLPRWIPRIDAAQALAWALVSRLAPDGQALAAAQGLAREIAGRSVEAYAACNRLITDSCDTRLETQLERERAALSRSAASTDGREALAAFVSKRKPRVLPERDDHLTLGRVRLSQDKEPCAA